MSADRAGLVAAALWARGALGVWERPDSLVAWFAPASMPGEETLPPAPSAGLASDPAGAAPDAAGAAPGALAELPELVPERIRWSLEPDRDWQEEWKATIAPVRAGRVMVVPSWLAADHVAAPGELTLVLDPGRAFGSGHHATTTLCLELIDDLERTDGLEGRTLADIGCGTGVLAIAAAAWGARARAVDIDATAIEVTRLNAARNGVEVAASTGSVGDLTETAEVIVANLVTDVIVTLAGPLVAAATSTLIVSGIATGRRQTALQALEAAGARTDEVRERDGWIAARLTPGPRPAGTS